MNIAFQIDHYVQSKSDVNKTLILLMQTLRALDHKVYAVSYAESPIYSNVLDFEEHCDGLIITHRKSIREFINTFYPKLKIDFWITNLPDTIILDLDNIIYPDSDEVNVPVITNTKNNMLKFFNTIKDESITDTGVKL